MVSDMNYYCRIVGQENFECLPAHPGRSLEVVANKYFEINRFLPGTQIEISRSPDGKDSEIYTVLTKGDNVSFNGLEGELGALDNVCDENDSRTYDD